MSASLHPGLPTISSPFHTHPGPHLFHPRPLPTVVHQTASSPPTTTWGSNLPISPHPPGTQSSHSPGDTIQPFSRGHNPTSPRGHNPTIPPGTQFNHTPRDTIQPSPGDTPRHPLRYSHRQYLPPSQYPSHSMDLQTSVLHR